MPDIVLDPKKYGKKDDVTIFNIGVIIISESGAPYDLERTGVAVDMAVEEVNKDIHNASYMIQPIERKYGPVCDAAKAPGEWLLGHQVSGCYGSRWVVAMVAGEWLLGQQVSGY